MSVKKDRVQVAPRVKERSNPLRCGILPNCMTSLVRLCVATLLVSRTNESTRLQEQPTTDVLQEALAVVVAEACQEDALAVAMAYKEEALAVHMLEGRVLLISKVVRFCPNGLRTKS